MRFNVANVVRAEDHAAAELALNPDVHLQGTGVLEIRRKGQGSGIRANSHTRGEQVADVTAILQGWSKRIVSLIRVQKVDEVRSGGANRDWTASIPADTVRDRNRTSWNRNGRGGSAGASTGGGDL